MSKTVNVHEAKAHLSEYLAAVENGEEIIIARRNKPVARLVAVEPVQKKPRQLGQARGRIKIHPSFFEPMDEEELDLWDGTRMPVTDPLHPDFDPSRRTEVDEAK